MSESRAVSMAEVARAAGDSKTTVSLALRRDPQIPSATRERIRREALRLGYQRDPEVAELMARLRCGHSSGHETLALMNAHEDSSAFRTHPTIPVHSQILRKELQTRSMPAGRGVFWMEGGLFLACSLGYTTYLIATSVGQPAGP